jgi:two-component system chemotaxis sensor kinase CheA
MAQDRFKYFRIEARELLEGLTKGMLDLERQPDRELVGRLLRLAHTLKGAARIVGHRELADLAHQTEDVLEPLRDASAPQRLDSALALLDQMSTHVAALDAPPAAAPPFTTSASTAHQAAPAVEPLAPRADPGAIDDVLAGLAEVQTLVRRLREVADPRVLEQRIDHLERELREVRQDAERMRLAAIGSAFTQLERTARDVAHAAGKRVAFVSSGGDVRVDAHVLTTLHSALVQLVRNAVAHGIEPPDVRTAAGKPPEGQVAIAVALSGSRIAITCRDDGRGIDLDAVRRAAVRRGLAANHARDLDRIRLFDLLLRGGLTTSAEVTPFAGRGIGLDVVREAAQLLGGEVTATTGAAGTAITVVAPTSMAGVSALILRAGDRTCAIPLASIRRVARIAATAVLRGPEGLAVALDDILVPFAPLARLLGASGGGAPRSIAVVEALGSLVAIGADHVVGIEDVVVRALPASAPVEPIVWGVALDASGMARPILEPAALVAAARALPAESTIAEPPALPVLIVDDSLTTRMLEQSILESAGYSVEIAISAEEALTKIQRRTYGLCLVDVEMPGMDGFELIATMRSRPQSAAIPAILVTSRNRPEDLQRGTAVGAQGYVVKGDFDQTRLLDMIRRLVHR